MLNVLLTVISLMSPASACQMDALVVAEVRQANYKTCEFKVSQFSYYAPSTVCPLSKNQIKSSGIYVPGYCEHIVKGDSLQGIVFYKNGKIQLDR